MADALGLIPIHVDPAERTVTLIDADPSEFSEPFFETTAKRLTAELPERVVTVGWDDLISQSQSWPERSEVAGLIFNVGRCGSTLMANMMRAHPDLWVLSEPEPLSKPELFARRSQNLADRTKAEALYRANSILLQYRAASAEQKLVIKYPSWLAARAPTMAASHPEAAVFGLYRDPHKVVASYIEKPPAFAEGMHAPRSNTDERDPSAGRPRNPPLTGAAYYAAIWVSTMVGAMATDNDRLLLVDYAQLKGDATLCIDPLMSHLGLPVSDDVRSDIEETTRHYAKPRTAAKVAFDPAGTHARPELSPRTIGEIDRIVDDLEQTLQDHPCHLELTP